MGRFALFVFFAALACCLTATAATSQILLRHKTLDVNSIPSFTSLDTRDDATLSWLVKFASGVSAEARAVIEDMGLELGSYIPHDTFIVACTTSQASALSKLTSLGVVWVGHLESEYKLSPLLSRGNLPLQTRLAQGTRDVTQAKEVAVMFLREHKITPDMALKSVSEACKQHVGIRIAHQRNGFLRKIILEFPHDMDDDMIIEAMSDLAAVEFIEYVEPRLKMTVDNYFSHALVQSNRDVGEDMGSFAPFYSKNITGAGEVVGCGDTGLDTNNCFFYDSENPVPFYNYQEPLRETHHRKIQGYVKFADEWDNVGGHGTHVTGSIAGMMSNEKRGTHPFYKFHGGAYDAKLAFFDIGVGDSLILPDSLLDYFPMTYDMGARVHSNSWNTPIDIYSIEALEVDEYAYLNQDMLIVYSAGNLGASGFWTVGTPTCAKNIMSIGASMTSHHGWEFFDTNKNQIKTYNAYKAYCNDISVAASVSLFCFIQNATVPCFEEARAFCETFTPHTCCEHPELTPWCCSEPNPDIQTTPRYFDGDNLADFSSRGPAPDGRTKPDVLCPGSFIFSAMSHGHRTPETEDMCGTDAKTDTSAILHMRGTSMATPVCAGNIALLRQYLREGFLHDGSKRPEYGITSPPASLMRALLVNGARSLGGVLQEYGFKAAAGYRWKEMSDLPRPNMYEGYGRVNLERSVPHMSQDKPDFAVLIAKSSTAPVTDETVVTFDTKMVHAQNSLAMCFRVMNASEPVRVTMAYTDIPPSILSSMHIVADLDLIVLRNGERLVRGPTVQTEDRVNIVEHAEVGQPTVGDKFTVYVTAVSMPTAGPYTSVNFYVVASGNIEAVQCEPSCEGGCDHGVCTEGVCKCTDNYVGVDCSSSPCPSDCSHNGVCDYKTGVCKCSVGYKGTDCSVRDECPNSCGGAEQGVCVTSPLTQLPVCECKAGWFGTDCSIPKCIFTSTYFSPSATLASQKTNYDGDHDVGVCDMDIFPYTDGHQFGRIMLNVTTLEFDKMTKLTISLADSAGNRKTVLAVNGGDKPFAADLMTSRVFFKIEGPVPPAPLRGLVVSYQALDVKKPTISDIFPTSGWVGSVTKVSGKYLCDDADPSLTVTIGGVPCSVVSKECGISSTITCKVGSSDLLGPQDFKICSPFSGCADVAPKAFELLAHIKLVAASPAVVPVVPKGPFDVSIQYQGYPNCNITEVAIGSCVLSPVVHDEEIVVTITNSCGQAGPLTLTVTTANCGVASDDGALLSAVKTGIIYQVSPNKGSLKGSDKVNIWGINLGNGTDIYRVVLAGIDAEILEQDENDVTVVSGPSESRKNGTVIVYSRSNAWAELEYGFLYDNVERKIESVTPNVGSSLGGDVVTITGQLLVINATDCGGVFFGDHPAEILSVNDTVIVVKTPAFAPGYVPVVVLSAEFGYVVKELAFAYTPVITSVSPSWTYMTSAVRVVVLGDYLSILGDVFDAYIGGVKAQVVDQTNPKAVVLIAGGSAEVRNHADVKLVTSHGDIIGKDMFNYCENCPFVTTMIPFNIRYSGGVTMKIFGAGLANSTGVLFNGVAGSELVVVDDTHITVVSPANGASTGVDVDILVQQSGTWAPGPYSRGATHYYDAPEILQVSPDHGSIVGGTHVVIYGDNLCSGQPADVVSVSLAGVLVDQLVNVTRDSITVVSGATAVGKFGDVVVTSEERGVSILKNSWDYVPKDVEADLVIEPFMGPCVGGQTVVITGEGLCNGNVTDVFVSLAGVPVDAVLEATVDSVTVVTGQCSEGSENGPAKVRSISKSAVQVGGTYVYTPAGEITEIYPARCTMFGGCVVTITGVNLCHQFAHNSTDLSSITFLGYPVTILTSSSQLITVRTPVFDITGFGDVVIESAAYGKTVKVDGFKSTVPMSVSAIEPNNGPRTGKNIVTITGDHMCSRDFKIHNNFHYDLTHVYFDLTGGEAKILDASSTKIVLEMPAMKTAVSTPLILLSLSQGRLVTPLSYTFNQDGLIDRVVPDNANISGGVLVTITAKVPFSNGANDVTRVTLAGVPAKVIEDKGTAVVVKAGAATAACTGDVVVESTSHGTTVLKNAFRYTEQHHDSPHGLSGWWIFVICLGSLLFVGGVGAAGVVFMKASKLRAKRRDGLLLIDETAASDYKALPVA